MNDATSARGQTVPSKLLRLLHQAPTFSLASQAAGVLQLAALLWRYGPTNATDVYFYLFNLGNLPIQILIVGVFYPMLLSNDRITRSAATRFALWIPLGGLVAVGGGALWLGISGRVEAGLAPAVALAGANAVLQAMVWTRAVLEESAGDARWVAAVALPANIIGLLCALLPWTSSTATVTAMLSGLVAGNAAFLALAVLMGKGKSALSALPDQAPRRHRAHWWFASKSAVSYGGLMIVQSLALTLPPAVLTMASVPMKIVGSVAATFINAVMPRLVNQSTQSPASASRFLKLTAAAMAPLGIVGIAATSILMPTQVSVAIIVGLWLLVSAAAATAQRMAFRFLPPSASKVTLGVVPVIVLSVAVSIQFEGFGLVGLLCAYACVDGFSSTLWLIALRERLMVVLTGAVNLGLVTLWISSLT